MNTSMQIYGDTQEIAEMARRYKTALPGGDKLNNNEVMMLAQIAKITGLNPFVKELWFIPGKGPMIGIAGARRLWNEQSRAGGGWSHVDIVPCDPNEAGYIGDTKDLIASFRAEAHDSKATAEYQRLFTDTIRTMRETGSSDPFGDAKQICGPRPMWIGYGYSTNSETSRMNKTQLARKRAEADALKKVINVPFGVNISIEHDAAPDVIEAVSVNTVDETTGEILDGATTDAEKKAPAPAKPAPVKWTFAQTDAVIKAGYADNDFAARGMLGLSCLTPEASPEECVKWSAIYRSIRNPADKASPKAKDAADIANAEYKKL